MAMQRGEVLRTLGDVFDGLARAYRVESLWVFGSCARDELREDSDIDILIDFEPGALASLLRSQRSILNWRNALVGGLIW